MDPIGPSIASSVAGVSQAERAAPSAAKRAVESPRDRFKRALDEAELSIAQTESDDAVRSVKSNEQEDARQDHREHPAYTPGGRSDDDADSPPRLDVEG